MTTHETRGKMVRLSLALAACLLGLLLIALGLGIGRLLQVTNELRAEVVQLREKTHAEIQDEVLRLQKKTQKDLGRIRSELLMSEMASVVDDLTADATDTQEKVLRIAEWITGHISNRETQGGDLLTGFANRKGFCGTRSSLFVTMLRIEHIPARRFNMYNFGRIGGDHACAQAFYDGEWHFFDVTYGGAFIRDGKVLSWDEMTNDPETAVAHMRVFSRTRDRSFKSLDDDPVERRPIDNRRRMKGTYTVEALRNARTAGFVRFPDVKTLYPIVDLETEPLPMSLGTRDGSLSDVQHDGVRKGLSSHLGDALGNRTDTFNTSWEFVNGNANEEYVIEYEFSKTTHAGLLFLASGDKAEILEGERYETPEGLLGGARSTWKIRFRFPEDTRSCSVRISYEFAEPGRLASVDLIRIYKG